MPAVAMIERSVKAPKSKDIQVMKSVLWGYTPEMGWQPLKAVRAPKRFVIRKVA